MNNQQFIYWLGGFADAVGKEGPTPKQWEIIVSELNNIKEPISFPIGGNGWGAPDIWSNPLDKYKVTCDSETILTTTEGSGSSYSIITNGNTTSTTLPKGTNVSYTANLPKELLTD